MEGSFYAVLGVDADADDATVRAAYRAAVKEHHPDVSDDPDAGERFKRLTTARDVLLDPDERSRYDRLGHADYLNRHGGGSESGWSAGSGEGGGSPEGAGGGGTGTTAEGTTGTEQGRSPPGAGNRHRASTGRRDRASTTKSSDGRRSRSAERAAWFQSDGTAAGKGEPGGDPTPGSRAHRRARGRRHHVGANHDSAGDGGTSGRDVHGDWGMASEAYRRSAAASRAATERSRTTSPGELLASLGPWLVVYAVFVASAIATAAFTLSQAGVGGSLASFVFGLILFGLVVALSTLHVASRVARREGG